MPKIIVIGEMNAAHRARSVGAKKFHLHFSEI